MSRLASQVLKNCNVTRTKHVRSNKTPLLKGDGKVSVTHGLKNKIFQRIYLSHGKTIQVDDFQ